MSALLNRQQRRLLARYGIDGVHVGKVFNKAVPVTAGNFEEFLMGLDTPEKFQAAQKDGTFKNMVTGYMNSRSAERVDLLAQMKEQQEAFLTEWLKEHAEAGFAPTNRPDLRPATAGELGSQIGQPVYNPRAVGVGLDKLFASKADFFQAIWHNSNPNAEVQEKIKQLRNYSEKVPSEGGFLVPEEFRSDLVLRALERSVVRPRANVVPMGSAKLGYPVVDETTHVGSVYGGVVAYWTEEGATLTESQASFGTIKLDAKKLTAFAVAPNELVRDWGAFGSWIDRSMPAAVAWFEDLAFISGTGVGEPLGALNSGNAAIVSVAKETGQTAATVVWENVLKMYARLLPESLLSAIWLVTPDAFVELATMGLIVGTGGSAVWLPDGRGRPQLTLLGIPVVMSEKSPAVLGTKGDISLVDFSSYVIGDRQTMTVESSMHSHFSTDKTAFRCISRLDGRPSLLSALTPQNNGPTLSAFVQLDTRS